MSPPEQQLETYLVGGAVRDRLLGLPVKDRDWVVIGSSPEEMIELGFRPVGKDFPVFLHPNTHEEYALARTERKTAPGYHGFIFSSSPNVTLEQDLERRDLTMNAIAMMDDGKLVDPFNGAEDIANRIIRHVSVAFKEDPVRILRVAKFAARFGEQNFAVDSETLRLMAQMVVDGEVDSLVPERCWQEMSGALENKHFYRFVEVLRSCGALEVILPEVDKLFGVPQTAKYHPEIDTGVHVIMSLKAAGLISSDPQVMFSVLVHDLGKGLTPKNELPSHRGHEKKGLKPIKALSSRMAVPNSFKDIALKVCEYHLHSHRIFELRPQTILKLLEQLDGFRNPERIRQFVDSCLADRRGRTGRENEPDDASQLLLALHLVAQSVDAGIIAGKIKNEQILSSNLGKKIKQAVAAARVKALIEELKVRKSKL